MTKFKRVNFFKFNISCCNNVSEFVDIAETSQLFQVQAVSF